MDIDGTKPSFEQIEQDDDIQFAGKSFGRIAVLLVGFSGGKYVYDHYGFWFAIGLFLPLLLIGLTSGDKEQLA